MKVEEKHGGVERVVLTAMIVNDRVCGAVASKWDGQLFKSQWANIVGKWCVEFFGKHREAPRKSIASMYAS